MTMVLLALSTPVAKRYICDDPIVRPLAPQLETVSVRERVREVEQAASVRRRLWLFGAVVVKIAVSAAGVSPEP